MQLKESAKDVKLHGIKCYNIAARGIKTISFCKESKKLAVVRNDYSIEIWNLNNSPFLERVIPGKFEDSIEAVIWVGNRLFTVGLSGDGLKEWDLTTLTPKRTLLLTGERGICMDYHSGQGILAVGTEEGILNIFDVSDDDLQFHRLLDRQDHRIICCKFDDSGEKLVSGSMDAVKIWNVKTGQVIHKMSTGKSEGNQSTIVWCIDILNDFTIVTGDSRGKVTFWDGHIGSQIDYVHASTSDIMCLTVSEDRKSFFCSGMEQVLKKYTSVTVTKAGSEIQQWVRCAKRSKIHTHDVLAMIVAGDELVSGGVDGFISFGTQDFKQFHRIAPFLKKPFAAAAEHSRTMLMKYVDYLEVWKLASAGEISNETQETPDDVEPIFEDSLKPFAESKRVLTSYKIQDFPEKLLELRSKNDEKIVTCAISPDGRWIAYSTMSAVRLFHFEVQNNSKPKLQLLKNAPSEFKPCTFLLFTSDSNGLITISSSGHCSVFDLESEVFEHKDSFDVSDHHKDLIHNVVISKCSKFLAIASLCCKVTVWKLKRGKWEFEKTLPRHVSPVTSMKIRENSSNVVISFSDNRIIEYNLDSNVIQFSAVLPEGKSVITDICLDSRNPNAITFNQNNSINVLQRNVIAATKKKAKLEEGSQENFTTKVAKNFNTHLVHLEFLGNDELLAIEVNPVALIENLPPPMRKKTFGLT